MPDITPCPSPLLYGTLVKFSKSIFNQCTCWLSKVVQSITNSTKGKEMVKLGTYRARVIYQSNLSYLFCYQRELQKEKIKILLPMGSRYVE